MLHTYTQGTRHAELVAIDALLDACGGDADAAAIHEYAACMQI